MDEARGLHVFVDRMGGFFRVRGENVSSFEVETALARHPAVRAAAAIPLPAAEGDEDDIAAFVELEDGAALTVEELAAHAAAEMPKYMRPRHLRILDALKAHLETAPYLMGRRPGASDFGFYGQLTQLTHFDPTPMDETLRRAPRVFAWVDIVEDSSGVDPKEEDWTDRGAIPETIKSLLNEVGRVYAPVMLANAKALMNGDDEVRTEVDGREWVQQPFPYQGKCLAWLREKHAALSAADREAVDTILAGTGCEALFVER